MKISKGSNRVRKYFRIICGGLCALLGIVALVVSILAYQFGIDHNQEWGLQRVVLASLGILLILLSAYIHSFTFFKHLAIRLSTQTFLKHFIQSIQKIKSMTSSPSHEKLEGFRKPRYSSRNNVTKSNHAQLWVIAGSVIAIIIATWFITNGTFFTWIPDSNYFDRLANAFLKGSFSLLEKPPTDLLALPNPYDWRVREGINYIWDASLFEGKYYLYFGPVPALVAMVVKWFHQFTVDDQYILMFFYAGFVISLAMVLHWTQKTFFLKTPVWTVLIFTLLGGLCVPVLWLMKEPNVYETSILGGQFFLILGLYAVLRGMQLKEHRKIWFCFGGFIWGASVGCRMNNVAGIVLMLISIGIFLLKDSKKKFLPQIFWLMFPLAIWAVFLGYYNYARFGNFFETGHQFQLTGPAYSSDFQDIFSVKYIIPNIYNMFFRPPEFSLTDFPFVFAPFIQENMWPWYIHLPEKYYYSEPITGLFIGVPVFCLIFTAFIRVINKFIKWINGNSVLKLNHKFSPLIRTWGIVFIGLIGNVFSIAMYISSTMRYLVDIAPLMVIFLSICIWWELDHLQNWPFLKNLFLCILVFLCIGSITISLLINFHNNRFIANNPTLYYAITQMLSSGK